MKITKTLLLAIPAFVCFSFLYYSYYANNNPAVLARNKEWETVKVLIRRHPSWARRTDCEGRTALHYVEDSELALSLIRGGAGVDLQDMYGFTPLHTVSHLGVVEVLLANGANPNIHSYVDRYTPLHCVCSITSLNSHTRSAYSESPPPREEQYMFSESVSYSDRKRKIRLLLEHGADVNAVAAFGETPLDICVIREIQKLLIDNGGKILRRSSRRFWDYDANEP